MARTRILRSIAPGLLIGIGGGLIAAFTAFGWFGIVLSIVGLVALVVGLWWQVSGRGEVIARVSVETADSPRADERIDEYRLSYRQVETDGTVCIHPEMGYLSRVFAGGPVEEVSYQRYPFAISNPVLDIVVVNNSGQTLLVTGAVVRVDTSRPLARPILVVANNSRPARTVLIVNEGGGVVGPSTLRFSVADISDRCAAHSGSYDQSVQIPSFERSCFVDLSDPLKAAGIDIATLEALQPVTTIVSAQGVAERLASGEELSPEEHDRRVRAACAPYSHRIVNLIGELEYTWSTSQGEPQTDQLTFATTATLIDGTGYFPGPPPSIESDVVLDDNREAYERRVLVRQVVGTGEAETLKLRVGATSASLHNLRICVTCEQYGEVTSDRFSLEIFVPRSSVDGNPWEWLYH